MTQRPNQTLQYNPENQLTAVTGTPSASFVYDGDGNRVKSTLGGGPAAFIGNHSEWEVGTGSLTRYYYAGSTRVAMRKNNNVYYLLGDHLPLQGASRGSTSVVTQVGGGVESQSYTAWGELRAGGISSTKRQYTGQINEASLGLYFYNARFYDGALGRFVQADTMVPQPGSPQGWDRYAYTLNSPVNFTDPSGHMQVCADGDRCGSTSTPTNNTNNLFYFSRLPVEIENVEWIQWFGGTEFAYQDHLAYQGGKPNYNYDGYCQGYHCGIDLGADWGTPVYAGISGKVLYAAYGILIIENGDYQIRYEALNGNYFVKAGDFVIPTSLVSEVGNHSINPSDGNYHLHVEVTFSSTGRDEYKDRIANPLLFMDMSLYEDLWSKVDINYPAPNTSFHNGVEQNPLKQISPIKRGGPVLWN